MFRRFILSFVLMTIAGFACFGQASAIRDYVGMISQTFHPDVVSFMEQFKSDLEKRGYSAAARSVDNYLKGESGTGFVYVAGGGKNYILTNYHVISQAHTLSVAFEKPDGERTKYSDLSIVAADEEMDIALLSFAGGQNPFRQGLAFMTRQIQEGDDVYSAGFPGLGNAMVWQLGRGMVSNASVRFPESDDPNKMLGPFIQHTAQVDPGNSGGPLLVQAQGVPTGFAVAGINTRSARYRQAANFSIPLNKVQSFLDASLRAQTTDELASLNARVSSFVEGLGVPKAVYPHISTFLSNACTGENAEYALEEMLEKASRSVRENIVQEFVYSPVDGMAYAVAWTIENALRSKSGKISITSNPVTKTGDGKYAVSFNVDGKTINSEWVNEHGTWKIRTFGDFASGDKSLIGKKKQQREISTKLITEPSLRISGNLVSQADVGALFGVDLKISSTKYTTAGFLGYFSNDVKLFSFQAGFCVPIEAGNIAFIPFADAAAGLMFMPKANPDEFGFDFHSSFGLALKGGLMFTTTAVPGLYLQAAYQHNFFKDDSPAKKNVYENMLIFGIGYSF